MLRQKRLLGNGSEAAEDRRGANATQGFMPHDVALITTIAVGFALAFTFGFIANRLGLPPLVGYLVAGIAVGPSTPGFVRRQRDGGAAGRNRSHAFDDRHWSSFFRGGLADGSRLR